MCAHWATPSPNAGTGPMGQACAWDSSALGAESTQRQACRRWEILAILSLAYLVFPFLRLSTAPSHCLFLILLSTDPHDPVSEQSAGGDVPGRTQPM